MQVEDGQGCLVLHRAVLRQLPQVVKLLVDTGADWLSHTAMGAGTQLRECSPLLLLARACLVGPACLPVRCGHGGAHACSQERVMLQGWQSWLIPSVSCAILTFAGYHLMPHILF